MKRIVDLIFRRKAPKDGKPSQRNGSTLRVAVFNADEIDRLLEELETARNDALEEAANFVEGGISPCYPESVNAVLRVNAYAIRQMKEDTP